MSREETYTLLIADDEPEILAVLREYFARQGYRVLAAADGEQALALAQGPARPDLLLLDVMMPGMDGLSLCRRLRNYLDCPILLLTARVEDADALAGFEAGADDYIPKPFSLPVLQARVEAHLSREHRAARSAARSAVRFAGNVTVDFPARAVLVNERPVALTKREFAILSLLARHPGRVFDREHIHENVGGWEAASSAQGVTELIRRIRQKLADAGADNDPVETVWGVGYRWRA